MLGTALGGGALPLGPPAPFLLQGGFVGFERTPLFTDLFDLLVLIVTPSVFDNHCLCAIPVWLLYNLRPIAHIVTAIGKFDEVSFLSIFLGVELASA